jgi:hypothetical protein
VTAGPTRPHGKLWLVTDRAHQALPPTVTVPKGTPVTITVLSATPREFHLHGYDLEQQGTKVVFQLTADLTGTFELEAHDNEQVVLVLEVV